VGNGEESSLTPSFLRQNGAHGQELETILNQLLKPSERTPLLDAMSQETSTYN
jgi:hypothetical protein